MLATVGALCGAVAMFGAVGYLPTYLQIVDRLARPRRACTSVPVVLGIGTTAFASGHIMSRTGRYAWMPVAGALIVAAALACSVAADVDLALARQPDAYLFGAGIGFGMQTLTIVAQNAFPAEVGHGHRLVRVLPRDRGRARRRRRRRTVHVATDGSLAARLPARLANAHALTPASVTAFPPTCASASPPRTTMR